MVKSIWSWFCWYATRNVNKNIPSNEEVASVIDRRIVEVEDGTNGRVIRFEINGHYYNITRTRAYRRRKV
jgi:hypothetical protein